ncbi:hypothetical protein M011DRAFT_403006 [Sporormia fimetaria CBS 119925]|uniref:Uncharacterized protein n=1 Tax=Sporormia fimetaria CBS 119925 TaxID=1340428 RepID=A0A6A6VBF3_9PLEO|nr:hypothetical protein M011DRAFT_403006 [Sporormia fimetaria CBS 119925]
MDPSHRKIELQSLRDLTFLTTSLRTHTAQKLDTHLPPSPDPSASYPLRTRTSELLDTFLDEVLKGMRANTSINGIALTSDAGGEGGADAHANARVEEEIEYEDLDYKLQERLRVLFAKRERLVKSIAVHRRGTAKAAAERFREGWEKEGQEWEEARGEMERRVVEEARRSGEGLDVQMKRLEEVEGSWERVVTGLAELQRGLPETRARLERAGEVVGYLGG